MQKFQDVVLDSQGRPVAGAVIAVQEYPGGGAATVYQTDAVGTAYEPTTDELGAFYFYAENGTYSYTVTVANVLRKTVTDVILYDPSVNGYEDGTWTPTLVAAGATFNYAFINGQRGYYAKIGGVVIFNVLLRLATSGNTLTANPLTITGLPFTSGSSLFRSHVGAVILNATATALYGAKFSIGYSSTTITLYKEAGATTAPVELLANDLDATAGTEIFISGQYFV